MRYTRQLPVHYLPWCESKINEVLRHHSLSLLFFQLHFLVSWSCYSKWVSSVRTYPYLLFSYRYRWMGKWFCRIKAVGQRRMRKWLPRPQLFVNWGFLDFFWSVVLCTVTFIHVFIVPSEIVLCILCFYPCHKCVYIFCNYVCFSLKEVLHLHLVPFESVIIDNAVWPLYNGPLFSIHCWRVSLVRR